MFRRALPQNHQKHKNMKGTLHWSYVLEHGKWSLWKQISRTQRYPTPNLCFWVQGTPERGEDIQSGNHKDMKVLRNWPPTNRKLSQQGCCSFTWGCPPHSRQASSSARYDPRAGSDSQRPIASPTASIKLQTTSEFWTSVFCVKVNPHIYNLSW